MINCVKKKTPDYCLSCWSSLCFIVVPSPSLQQTPGPFSPEPPRLPRRKVCSFGTPRKGFWGGHGSHGLPEVGSTRDGDPWDGFGMFMFTHEFAVKNQGMLGKYIPYNMYIDPIVGFGKKTCQWATWISVATVLEPLFWGVDHDAVSMSSGLEALKENIGWISMISLSLEHRRCHPLGLCGDFMVIFKAFKTKVQDRKRPRIAGFLAEHGEWFKCFFFERLVSFYHYFHIFPGSKYFAKVPSKKSTQCAPQVSHTSPENWWFPSSVHLLYLWGAGFFRWTNHQTSKVYLLTTATNPSSKFYWQPHLTGRMHPLGCSLTTLVIHFHARHLFFRAFFFGVKLLKGTKRLRIWI